ncbi:MAG: DUF1080 domain-containing protein [Acidobacteria bacterium]|nr:DUF1080 domain-containing protein [Acidobacteriota bacterium]
MRFVSLLGIAAAWAQPDAPRPVDPGGAEQAPSDAIVLFDGGSLAAWRHPDGRAAEWAVEDGAMVCKSGKGDIQTMQKFGSAQIHVEFSTPDMPNATSQAKGNSGVYLQGRYEIQVLDSYKNPTYSNGSAAAVYGQHPPLVNASKPPGQWQTYDFVFHAARCDADGKVEQPARLTLHHNGVLVQDNVNISKPTPGDDGTSMCENGPIRLQDHFHPDVKDTPLKFRNLWVRSL